MFSVFNISNLLFINWVCALFIVAVLSLSLIRTFPKILFTLLVFPMQATCLAYRGIVDFTAVDSMRCRLRWPRGLRRRSAATRLLRSWVRISPGAWMFVCCECFVLSGGGLCDGLITLPEESYRLWSVVMCDLETSRMRRPWPTGGLWRQEQTAWGVFDARKLLFV